MRLIDADTLSLDLKIASNCGECPRFTGECKGHLSWLCKRIANAPTIEVEPINNIPRLLTIEEVLSSGDKLMWLEIKHVYQQLLFPTSPFNDNRKEAFSICFQSGEVQVTGLYGKQWRCWTQKPSIKQMEETEWRVTNEQIN